MLTLLIIFSIPIIMVTIGLLYKLNYTKEINNIFIFLKYLFMIYLGIYPNKNKSLFQENKLCANSNRKYFFIWTFSGLTILIINFLLIILNLDVLQNIDDTLLVTNILISLFLFFIFEIGFKKFFYNKFK